MKVTVKLDLNREDERLSFQMMEKASSIYFALREFEQDARVESLAKDILFKKLANQQDGLLDLFFSS